jgi:hypothetical protein
VGAPSRDRNELAASPYFVIILLLKRASRRVSLFCTARLLSLTERYSLAPSTPPARRRKLRSGSPGTLVERFFAEITTTHIRRGTFTSVADLEDAIYHDLTHHNAVPAGRVGKRKIPKRVTTGGRLDSGGPVWKSAARLCSPARLAHSPR